MKALSDLVKERSEELSVQISSAKPMTNHDLQWIKFKQYVDNIPANYMEFLEEKLKKDAYCVKRMGKSGKIILIYDEEWKYGEGNFDYFTLRIEIVELEKLAKKVTYFGFDPFGGEHTQPTAYIRDIISKWGEMAE